MKAGIELELELLKLRAEIAAMEFSTAHANYDLHHYGAWQCNWGQVAHNHNLAIASISARCELLMPTAPATAKEGRRE